MSYLFQLRQNNLFFRWLLAFLVLEFFSALAWLQPNLAGLFLIMLAFAILFLLFVKPIFALYIPLAEIFWGSLGHSIEYNFLSIRLLIFLLVIFVFIFQNIDKLKSLKILKDRALLIIFLFLLLVIFLAVVSGYYNTDNTLKVFYDANAYFYILYLPVWYQVYDKKYLPEIFDILASAVLVISVKTIILLNIFSQNYGFLHIDKIYQWVRDSRTGEITPFRDDFFRIFMQSQFYLILAWFLCFIKQFKDFNNKYNFLLMVVVSAALFISLSRSFWLGIFSGILFVFINIFIFQKKKIPWHAFINLGIIILAALLVVEIFYNLPSYKNFNIFTQRSANISEAAASTRTQLWSPMWHSIAQRPIIGHGFGQEITYQSNDPRIKNLDNPEGWHSTYAFEWGWMDQLVKGGILLVFLFIAWIIQIYYRAYKKISENPMLYLALISALTSLLIIHIFTPYINHPLGLSLLMLLSIIFGPYVKKSYSHY